MLVKLLRVQDLPEGNRVHKVRLDDCGAFQNIGHTRRSRSSMLTSSVNGGAVQEVHGRSVTILRHHSKVYAVDTSCFHQGGPLGTQGEIEDINGVSCLRCPWHNYRVSSC